MLQIEYPCFPREIINKDYIIEVAAKGVHTHRARKFRMDELYNITGPAVTGGAEIFLDTFDYCWSLTLTFEI